MDNLPDILEMAEQARAYLKSQGLNQWQKSYPGREDFLKDMEEGSGWLFTLEAAAAGYICIRQGREPAYEKLQAGMWKGANLPYVSVHRVMVRRDLRGSGLATEMMALAEELTRGWNGGSIRVDTHPDNLPMLGMLRKCGFQVRGTIKLLGECDYGSPRTALEKVLT